MAILLIINSERLWNIKFPILVFLFFLSVARTCSAAAEFDDVWRDSGFQYPDGAMPVYPRGDYIEPYFSIKALLVAHRMGLNVRSQAEAFGRWLLPRQRTDGRFARYCRVDSKDTIYWEECGNSDADDALAALWCVLIVDVMSGSNFDQSCLRSLDLLARLWNPRKKVYRSLLGHPLSQFADNIEVYFSLQRLKTKTTKKRFGKAFFKHKSRLSLSNLKTGIEKTFYYSFAAKNFPKRANDYNPPGLTPVFYPDGVAPLYVWMYRLQPEKVALSGWAEWKKKYLVSWQSGTADQFPWGLAAMVADIHYDFEISRTWLKNSSFWRHTDRWNLLEEAVWLGLKHKQKMRKPGKNRAGKLR
jgi:hypothetical protein